ncbi:hypothetical protein [Egicoccus sp. AB-alg6-2]|uniref:hypothetical protein n=1 Tax=Egicoccus sp. AB-alg6-2 TaxID=3242692 RepID=UPI00359EF087
MAGRSGSPVGLATAAAAAVLALAAAVVEPYLAAAGDAATANELARLTPGQAGLTVTATGRFSAEAAAEVGEQIAGTTGIDPVGTTVRADPATLIHDGAEQRMRLVGQAGADLLLDVLEGDPAVGLAVPEPLADDLALRPGDRVTLQRGSATVDHRIGAIYRALDPETAPPGLGDLAMATVATGRSTRPLDLVFAAPDVVLDSMVDLRGGAAVSWRVPVPPDLTGRSHAAEVRSGLQDVAAAVTDPRTRIGQTIENTAGRHVEAAIGLTTVLDEADRAVSAVAAPARIAGFAGQAVALVVVGMTALFAARQRATELRLENVRGRSLPLQGLRAATRALPALLAGTVVGWAAAVGTIALANAPRGVPPPVATGAVGAALATVPAALLVVGVTTAVVAGLTVRVGRVVRVRRLRRFPWELAALGLAGVAFLQLRSAGGLRSVGGVDGLSPLVLAFPLLLLVGTVGLAIRVLGRMLPRLRRIGGEAGAASFLAIRRLAAARGAGLLLTGAAATALGLVVYTAALSSSLRVAVEEKAIVQLGAAAVAPLGENGVVEGTTTVLRNRGRLGPAGQAVDVLLVDADTFADVAFWRTELVGAPLSGLMAGLDRTTGDRLPVLLAGGIEGAPSVLDVPGFLAPLEVVARPATLPGQSSGRPLVVADLGAADAIAADAGRGADWRDRWRGERWAAGADATTILVAAGADPDEVASAADVAGRARLVAVAWALGALQALAILATVLALLGVLLFVAVRQRDLQVSYALSRRMGLRPSTHAVALLYEVLALLALALALATALGMLAAAAVTGGIDPLPDLLPAPRVVVPLGALGGVLVALVVAGGLGAVTLQRAADRADVAEVLRGA